MSVDVCDITGFKQSLLQIARVLGLFVSEQRVQPHRTQLSGEATQRVNVGMKS